MHSKACLVNAGYVMAPLSVPVVCRSRVLGFHITSARQLSPLLLFLYLGYSLIRHRVGGVRFATSVVSALNNHCQRVVLPLPGSPTLGRDLSRGVHATLSAHVGCGTTVGRVPLLVRRILRSNDAHTFRSFFTGSVRSVARRLIRSAAALRFNTFSTFHLGSASVLGGVCLPGCCSPTVRGALRHLSYAYRECDVRSLVRSGMVRLTANSRVKGVTCKANSVPFIHASSFSG